VLIVFFALPVFLNPDIVRRESGCKLFVSKLNKIIPAFSTIQNLLLRGDMNFPLKRIPPRPCGNVVASNTNGDSFCFYSKRNVLAYLHGHS